MRIQIRNWFTWDNSEKMLVTKAEPIPESLLEISNDLQNLSSSGAEIYDEAENFIFEPILTNEPNGSKNYSVSFIKKFGSPSVYHPVCCKIKESL